MERGVSLRAYLPVWWFMANTRLIHSASSAPGSAGGASCVARYRAPW